MGSRLSPARNALLLAVAVLLTAAGFYWTYGLFPIWWLAWLAPLPILWLAPRVGGWTAAGTAFVAMGLARLDLWSYYHLLHIPFALSIAAVVEPALVFACAVSLYRGFLRRDQPGRAVLAYPAVVVAAEYLVSLSQGTFGNTAYTQLRDLPVLQLAALTGIWGISFVVALAPAMVAALFNLKGKPRRNIAAAFVCVAVAVLAYGTIRLVATPSASDTVRVGFAETHLGADIFPNSWRPIMNLMQRYADQVRQLAAQGARIVVLPEMTVRVNDQVSDQILPQIDALFEQTARATGTQILIGVLHVSREGVAYNEGRLYSPAGTLETVYRKHHLVPVAEAGTTPGDAISTLPQPEGTVGIEICRDMDYPELSRRYAKQDVGIMIVPAWEFGPDYLWHGHMALMRAVEDGFSIARSAKQGYLTASDDRGRILAEKLTLPETGFITMLANVPVRHDSTLYQRWGDWFAWLDLVLLAVLLIIWLAGFRRSALRATAADSVAVIR
ncbi:MAG TPA: nitrilase-related carbon-nitrogen hydrolase [Terracidiphilus sp.]|nr:nitrilase-related carbon-nitrogen hydrolase [Terracidiphilus sp.]